VQGSTGGVASRIDASGRGWFGGLSGGAGPGGGQPGSGGFGGSGAGYAGAGTTRGTVLPGPSYGSHTQTTESGSAGGALGPALGGAGGGRISIISEGTIQIDGEVLCDGDSRGTGAGAGSGGSIELRGTTFVGNGLIRASGGDASGGGGAGSGGRVIVRGTTYAFAGTLVAGGGLSDGTPVQRAAAGTIYVDRGGPLNVVRVDAGGLPTANSTSFISPVAGTLEVANGGFARFTQPQTFEAISMQGNGRLSLQGNTNIVGNLTLIGAGNTLTQTIGGSTLSLQVNGATIIDAGSEINLDGMGFPGGQGPGAGLRRPAAEGGAGAGHGGNGTPDAGPNAGGLTYDDIRQPSSPGSGGGAVVSDVGGTGGGGLRLIGSQAVTVNGAIRANGLVGQGLAGSGSGGTIFIQAPAFAGSGLLQANGGGGEGTFGGGGGGRIGINATTLPFTGTFEAFGGISPLSNPGRGGAGTVFTVGNGDPLIAQLLIDCGGLPIGARTTVITTAAARDITIRNGASVQFQGTISGAGTFLMSGNSVAALTSSMSFNQGMILRNAGNILTARSPSLSALNINGPSMVIDAGSGIFVDGLGGAAQSGGGPGRPSNGPTVGASGAGYGGVGGGGIEPLAGGRAYGSPVSPSETGSGGGNGSPTNLGGAGGGGGRLSFSGSFTFNGFVSSNGLPATGAAGGGSGGSINITAASVAGSGTLSANGGSATGLGGGGGGGRISVSANSGSITGSMTAFGGASGTPLYPRGGAGTIYTRFGTGPQATTLKVDAGSPTLAAPTTLQSTFSLHNLIIANGANFERFLNGYLTGSLTVSGGARCGFGSGPQFINGSLILTGEGSSLAPTPNTGAGIELWVDGDMRLDPGTRINADGSGYPSGSGPGAGRPATVPGLGGSGGGFGGAGADSAGVIGGLVNGDPWRPYQVGSGGGPGNPLQLNPGGMGGGRISVDVEGVLTHNGIMSANGGASTGTGGGGSGGGILVRAATIAGNGVITANGGPAGLGGYGAGGGGRILVRSCNSTFPMANALALPGVTSGSPAQAGSVLFSSTLTITTQPFNQTIVRGEDLVLTVEAPGAIDYQWRRRGQGGFFFALADGGRISGTRTATLTISPSDCDDAGAYDCIVTDACGSAVTAIPIVTVTTPADHNNDGAIDSDDVIAYFADWDNGAAAADTNGDGGVDGDDIIDFFTSWDRGC
ncbi:MAG: GC-type dockerin domain-anchored protein, partial [Phycisphaerales bacterium]